MPREDIFGYRPSEILIIACTDNDIMIVSYQTRTVEFYCWNTIHIEEGSG